ncbi:MULTISPECIES: diaminopimelate epimerase [unclassified Rothia (in: high G+C Gram-positive bacteria)]|uniref:diaminopimelate epimerase n=1 Tax=unclassified Rothia (in: high G+C Gram-positive bacteria) TaxID=2689056 RepID=UPI00195AD98A|nr:MULTISPECIES: diaminopimelate epimerase [unclassified Rothia (in: high G+C Gram-positive bacteria)]MBM7051282.1 diaminopimelate epimerase [Rothia sp. ZJ1223]QRZ61077.1 diaminopimelate epimerase [Rothia sp. ZJ932]
MTEQERWGELSGIPLTKGQGTGNDFVFVTDEHGALSLDPELVARVCDRHFGIGADGFIRAIKTSELAEGKYLLDEAEDAEWFMDYRNADGSISEMCGNGVRAFIEYLITQKLLILEEGEHVRIGTRAGIKTVARIDNGYAVDMGPWSFIDGDSARDNGHDAMVTARGLKTPRPAVSISMGNPHTVVALGTEGKLEGLGLETAPKVTPVPPEGTNVEFVVPEEIEETEAETGEANVGAIRMRVYERGVGETLSCGTGACAAAAAVRFWGGDEAPDEWLVHVPGGTLAVTFVLGPDNLEHVVLAGPAEMTGKVTLG